VCTHAKSLSLSLCLGEPHLTTFITIPSVTHTCTPMNMHPEYTHARSLSSLRASLSLSLPCTDPTQVSDMCFKDCSVREPRPVCGNDGVLYDNICYLRQQNCYPPPDRQPPKIKPAEDESICNDLNRLPDL